MTEARFSFTTKIDGDLFTVRGDTAQEFDAHLTEAIIGGLSDKLRALQEATTTVVQATPVATEPVWASTPVTAPAAEPVAVQPAGLDVQQDRWGNSYTYGHPLAPDLPDGRGKYIQKDWTTKSGARKRAWVDPTAGPKPAKPGASEAPLIWIN